MPPGGLLLGDLVKQQDFRGSGELYCSASWFSWYLGFSGSGYGVNPGSVSDYINTALAGHRLMSPSNFNLKLIDPKFQPLQLVAQPLRHRFPRADLKVWIIWTPFWWGTWNPDHPRPLLRGTEHEEFWKTTLEGLKIIVSTLRERYLSRSACWVMLSRLICLIFPLL